MSESGDRRRRPGRPTDKRGPSRTSSDPGGRDSGPRRPNDRFAGKKAGGERGGRDRELEDRDPYGVKSVRNRHDDPPIPDDVVPGDLDRVARAQLKTLSKENADEVARHLAMAANLIEEDPQLAHRHAVSAARRAGRIAVVRESLAITAYSIGDFALALRELRTYRRISGRDDQLPMMVDSERGLGRPDRAIELGRSVEPGGLPMEVRVELGIAMSGARLDLGQVDRALVELDSLGVDPDTAFSWSPPLFDAYAAVAEELGRPDEAELWFERSDRARHALHRASGGDEDETIDVIEEDVPVGEPAPSEGVAPPAAETEEVESTRIGRTDDEG